MGDDDGLVDGRVLLKHSCLLFRRYVTQPVKETCRQPTKEIGFLVLDFLSDSQVFQGFDCDLPNEYRKLRTSYQIARLNDCFHAVDKAEEFINAHQLKTSHGKTENEVNEPFAAKSIPSDLNQAARIGNEKRVITLLRKKTAADLCLPETGLASPLIEAIQHEHASIVQLLVEHGANVNVAVEGKLPLLVAVRAGRSDIINLLLEAGAAPIRLSCLPEAERLWLAKSRSSQGFDPSTLFEGVSAATCKVYRLYWEFRENFTLCAKALPHRECCEYHSKAWDMGIGVMRGLCQGKPPSSVEDTLLFLCLTHAMAKAMDGQDFPELEARFMKDLGRWQFLSGSKHFDLPKFQSAVAGIWHTDLRNYDCAQNPDHESLMRFQGLARSLRNCPDRCLEEETSNTSDSHGSAGLSMVTGGSQNCRQKLLEAPMCSDQNSPSQESVADVLMAGGSFMIFIMFLLCTF